MLPETSRKRSRITTNTKCQTCALYTAVQLSWFSTSRSVRGRLSVLVLLALDVLLLPEVLLLDDVRLVLLDEVLLLTLTIAGARRLSGRRRVERLLDLAAILSAAPLSTGVDCCTAAGSVDTSFSASVRTSDQ
eukprot:6491444-Amphidinium_carterae.1